MMLNATIDATVWVAIARSGAGSQRKMPSIRLASAGSPIQPRPEGGQRDAELGSGDVAVERLYGTAGQPSFAVAGAGHLVEAGLSRSHQREFGRHEEGVGQHQDDDRAKAEENRR